MFWYAVSVQAEQTQMRCLTFAVDSENKKMLEVLKNKAAPLTIDYQKATVYCLKHKGAILSCIAQWSRTVLLCCSFPAANKKQTGSVVHPKS